MEQDKDLFAENLKSGELKKLTLEKYVAKPWIHQNFDRKRAFQHRKAFAIGMQSSPIPLHERRAYKKRLGLELKRK